MLEPIGRGTTPVISFKFNNVNVDDIVVAFFTLRQGKTTIEKDLHQCHDFLWHKDIDSNGSYNNVVQYVKLLRMESGDV